MAQDDWIDARIAAARGPREIHAETLQTVRELLAGQLSAPLSDGVLRGIAARLLNPPKPPPPASPTQGQAP